MKLFKTRIEKMIAAWKKAEWDLGIEIQTPFVLREYSDKIFADILVKDYGSKKGTVILTINDMDDCKIPMKYGYYCSALNPINYKKYHRESFIETLSDWGFFGEENKKPDWFIDNIWEKND